MKPTISIIIPVYEEAEIIQRTLSRTRCLPLSERCEIIVVDGHADASTVRTVTAPAVRLETSAKGRGEQMNRGAEVAAGEILLFLHADTILANGALAAILEAVEEPSVAGGAFKFRVDSPRTVFRIIEFGVSLRYRLTGIPYGDQAIFLRKECFNRVGGYRKIPLMEDVDLMQRVRRAGGHIRLISRGARTSPRRWESEGVLYCTLRNWSLILLYRFGVTPDTLAKWY